MYKIKEFSEITNIPVATLRYYDEIDLLYPSSTDINTGYRYYEDKQLYKANLIVELKKLGLSLDEIKEYQKRELPSNVVIPVFHNPVKWIKSSASLLAHNPITLILKSIFRYIAA